MTKPQPGFRIDSLWAFTCIGPDDEEGIVGYYSHEQNSWIPLVCSDNVRLDLYYPVARDIANRMGQPVHLTRFDNRTDIDTIFPENQKLQ